jgi:hypothetical protein
MGNEKNDDGQQDKNRNKITQMPPGVDHFVIVGVIKQQRIKTRCHSHQNGEPFIFLGE